MAGRRAGLPIAGAAALVRHRNNLEAIWKVAVEDYERESPEIEASGSVVADGPASGRFGNFSYCVADLSKQADGDGLVSLQIPVERSFEFGRSFRVKLNALFCHARGGSPFGFATHPRESCGSRLNPRLRCARLFPGSTFAEHFRRGFRRGYRLEKKPGRRVRRRKGTGPAARGW